MHGDCVRHTCSACDRLVIRSLNIECPDGHGQQKASTGFLFGLKLACGCEFEDAGVEGGWIRKKHAQERRGERTGEL